MQSPQEHYLRHCLSVTIQRVLLVLRCADCLLPCARWYAHQLLLLASSSSSETREALSVPSTKKDGAVPAYLKELGGHKQGTSTVSTM